MNDKVQDIKRGERLREERERLKLTLVAISKFGSVSRGSQILYEKGSPPTADYLGRIAAKGADVLYILTGDRNPSLVDGLRPLPGDVRIKDQDYSTITVYDVEVAAGNGIVPLSDAASDQVAFTRTWLMQHGIAADLAGLVKVRGNSMTPTIPDGAYVLVDFRARSDWSLPGIYIVRLDDAIVVKRLQLPQEPGDNWVALISDNPDYPPFVINNPDSDSFQPIARVRAVIAAV